MPNDRATVLVTGGAGFIGSHSVDQLLVQGCRVCVLDDFSAGRQANLPAHPDLTVLRGDIRDADDVQRAMRGVTHVLHLAAQVSVAASIEMPLASASRNLLGFINVLEQSRQSGIKRIVYASSAAVYGKPLALPLTESAALRPMSPYSLEKQINEQYAALYISQYGLSCLGLRYFNVYGPRQDPQSPYSGVVSRFIEQALNHGVITIHGDGEQTRDLIHVHDVACANVRALFAEPSGVINVGTGHAHSIRALASMVSEQINQRVRYAYLPARKGDIRDSVADTSQMHHLLGDFLPTDLPQGLATLLAKAH